jgi:hypothetical protein
VDRFRSQFLLVYRLILPQETPAQRKDYKQLFRDRVFEVGPILSQKECRYYIEATEKLGYDGIEWEYSPEYRY